jgi:hypothetical protein
LWPLGIVSNFQSLPISKSAYLDDLNEKQRTKTILKGNNTSSCDSIKIK